MAYNITCYLEHASISGTVYTSDKAQALAMAAEAWGVAPNAGLWFAVRG